ARVPAQPTRTLFPYTTLFRSESVQGRALPVGTQQTLLIGLAVHRDQILGKIGQQAHWGRAATHGRTRAPFGRYGTGHEKDIVLEDRKSTRLNSSHVSISYAVF